MKISKRVFSFLISLIMIFVMSISSYADSTGEVITLGANLKPQQKQEILNYFGVSANNPNIIYVNNQQERKYLSGIAPDAQIGHVTMSSSYVVPTSSGGINVKTSNITWVTSSMIASTLATAGVENANVVAAAPFPVSGTGALTGIIIAFEKSSGHQLTEEKKKLANKELVTTGNLAEQVGKDKASGIINDAKKEVIQKDIKDKQDLEKTVKDIAERVYDLKTMLIGENIFSAEQKKILLKVVDNYWVDHIDLMDQMRQSVGLVSVAQKDPVKEYTIEAYSMFETLNKKIRLETLKFVFSFEGIGEEE